MNAAAKDRYGILASTPRVEIETTKIEGNGQRGSQTFKLVAVCCTKECLKMHPSFRKAKPEGVRTVYVEAGDSEHPALRKLCDWEGVKVVQLGAGQEEEGMDVDSAGKAAPTTPAPPSITFEQLKKKDRIAVFEDSPRSGTPKWFHGTVVELMGSLDSVYVRFDGGNGVRATVRWVTKDEQWQLLERA